MQLKERPMNLTPEQTALIKSTIPVLKEHGAALTAYFYNRMITNNPELKEIFNITHQQNGAQARALAGAVLAYAENIEHLENLAAAVSLIAHKHVSLEVQPAQYAIVGEHLLHSISEVLNIPMESELIAAWAVAYDQLATLLINAEQNVYSQHKNTPHGWCGWKRFTIVKKEVESAEITSFYLKPQDGSKLPQYQAGQYISLRITVPELGIKQPRQYSLSDCSNAGYFRISVKKDNGQDGLREGYVSTILHNCYKVGDIVELTNPTGDFILHHPEKRHVLISGGVGLTPMIAMLNTLVKNKTPADISFIHACRNERVLSMYPHIKQLQQQHKNIHFYLVCGEQPTGNIEYNKTGELDLHQLDRALLPGDADYYLCGPKAFMTQQYQALLELGIPEQQLFLELFNTGGVADIES